MNYSVLNAIEGIMLNLYRWIVLINERHDWAILKNEFNRLGIDSYIPSPRKIYNPKYISIGNNFTALHNTRLEAFSEYYGQVYSPKIIIGDNVSLNSDCHIGCIDKVFIGNNVLIASRVFISDHSHGETSIDSISLPPYLRPLTSKGPIVIEDNVWIGEGVCILSGVTVGTNSIIGANSVVTKDIPPNSVAAGIPAKIVKRIS